MLAFPDSSGGEASSAAKANVLIVEDHPIVRHGLVHLISTAEGLAIAGSAGTQAEALSLIQSHPVDLVLLDLFLGPIDTIAFIADLVRDFPNARILVLSAMPEGVYAERVLRAGALGYIMKSADMSEVLLAVESVLQGRVYLSPKIAVPLFRGLLNRSPASAAPGAEGLSDRELQIFQLIGAGTPNREIARLLGISVKTVETHRENLKNKLGAADATELMAKAQRFVGSLVA